jgi:hypothetical protein
MGFLSVSAFAQEGSEPGYEFVAQELRKIKGQIVVLKQAISKQTSLGQGQSIALKSQLSNLDVDVKALAESLLALQADARALITKENEVKTRTEIEVKALIEKLTEAQVDTATRLNQLGHTNQKIILIFGGVLSLLLVGLLIKIFKRSSSSGLSLAPFPSSTSIPTSISADVDSEDAPVNAQNRNETIDSTYEDEKNPLQAQAPIAMPPMDLPALTTVTMPLTFSSAGINALINNELQRTQQTLDQAKQGFMQPVDIL